MEQLSDRSTRRRWRPVRLTLGTLVLALVLVGTAFTVLQHSGRPRRSGDHQVPRMTAAVDVRFDARGVPHVTATSVEDLMRALGWLHANDRITQMELGRRAVAGRLSELLGEATLEADIYFRTLRFFEAADAGWRAASEDSRALLEAYAEGVNAWLEERGSDLPPALRVLGADPEPWTPRDSLAFALLMAQDLSFWDGRPEEYRFEWLRALGEDRLRQLLGDPDLHVPPEILDLAQGTSAVESRGPAPAEASTPEPELAGERAAPGSNNWAVGSSRTESGAPILANDPHLGLYLPSVWYQVQLRAPGYEAAGMTLPGTPGVVIGRGPSLAWAFTNVMLDDHDLFFERLDESGERVLRGDVWVSITTDTQTIRIRGGDSHTFVRRSTDIGPLLEADSERGLPARSLAWTALEPGDPLAALRGLPMAEDVEGVLETIAPFVCPAQNLVVAFADGRLLHTTLGRVPERRRGDGRLPAPAWDPSYGWNGLRPPESNPRVVDPAEDLLVTANHDIRPPGYDLPFVADFFAPFRHDRIRERLLTGERWAREDIADLQLDAVSLHALEVIGAALEAASQAGAEGPPEGDAGRALEALRQWDGTMAETGASALFALFQRELMRAIFLDEQVAAGVERSFSHRDRLTRLIRGEMDAAWFDDVSTPEVEGRAEIFAGALASAWAAGEARWGRDVAACSYGALHPLSLEHRLESMPLFGDWASRGPFPVAGSATTILAFGGHWRGDRIHIAYGPSMRFVMDWSDPDRAWMVLPGGQSGHPADRHYDDQIRPYLRGELFEAPWSESAIEAATVRRLRLVP
ncbi:MAG: penicillin acylase family protein [Holophagales bacterium]|nr:penicillin acylase family protein [Holophagales bacterium]